MSSQIPLYSLSSPSQYPVIGLVNNSGGTASLDSYVTPHIVAPIIAAFDARYMINTTTTVAVANRAFFYRIPPNMFNSLTVTKLTVYIGTSSGNLDLAVYSDNGSRLPGTRKASVGGVAAPAAGVRELTITSTNIVAGDWLAVSADNTTLTLMGTSGTMVQGIGALAAFQDSAYPLPATATATLACGRNIYIEGRP